MYVQAVSTPVGLLPNKPALTGRSSDFFPSPTCKGWHLFPLSTNPFNVMIHVHGY